MATQNPHSPNPSSDPEGQDQGIQAPGNHYMGDPMLAQQGPGGQDEDPEPEDPADPNHDTPAGQDATPEDLGHDPEDLDPDDVNEDLDPVDPNDPTDPIDPYGGPEDPEYPVDPEPVDPEGLPPLSEYPEDEDEDDENTDSDSAENDHRPAYSYDTGDTRQLPKPYNEVTYKGTRIIPKEVTRTVNGERKVVGYKYVYENELGEVLASVLVQNDVITLNIPRIYVAEIKSALRISEALKASQPNKEYEVRFNSGLRLADDYKHDNNTENDDHGDEPSTHHLSYMGTTSPKYPYRGVDMKIIGRNSYEFALILYISGKYNSILAYPTDPQEKGHSKHAHASQYDQDKQSDLPTLKKRRWDPEIGAHVRDDVSHNNILKDIGEYNLAEYERQYNLLNENAQQPANPAQPQEDQQEEGGSAPELDHGEQERLRNLQESIEQSEPDELPGDPGDPESQDPPHQGNPRNQNNPSDTPEPPEPPKEPEDPAPVETQGNTKKKGTPAPIISDEDVDEDLDPDEDYDSDDPESEEGEEEDEQNN